MGVFILDFECAQFAKIWRIKKKKLGCIDDTLWKPVKITWDQLIVILKIRWFPSLHSVEKSMLIIVVFSEIEWEFWTSLKESYSQNTNIARAYILSSLLPGFKQGVKTLRDYYFGLEGFMERTHYQPISSCCADKVNYGETTYVWYVEWVEL